MPESPTKNSGYFTTDPHRFQKGAFNLGPADANGLHKQTNETRVVSTAPSRRPDIKIYCAEKIPMLFSRLVKQKTHVHNATDTKHVDGCQYN